LRVLPGFGSDHRPYLADLCFDPASSAWQSPPPMWPADIEEARTAVLAGQGKADQAAAFPSPEKVTSGAPAGDNAPALPADAVSPGAVSPGGVSPAAPTGEPSPARP
jgi:hypothetical protein